jgi:hypothetical protein
VDVGVKVKSGVAEQVNVKVNCGVFVAVAGTGVKVKVAVIDGVLDEL